MSEKRDHRVRLPKSWVGPRRVSINAPGLAIFLALDETNPQLQMKDLVLSDEQAEMLRQNGLSVRVLGKKPKLETE